jgi:protocatechuate 3,4-dioxygenase beta subunit
LILVLAIAVPTGLYIVSTVSFTNGTTGNNVSAPDVTQNAAQASNAQPATAGNAAAQQAKPAALANATAATPAAAVPTAATPARAARRAAVNPQTGKSMELVVTDADTKQPLPGLAVQNSLRNRFRGTTDANGHVSVPIPVDNKNPGYFFIRITGKGYIPKRLTWEPYNAPLNVGEVPTSYAMTMEHGTKISGKIVDDTGAPVEGANVILEFNKKYANAHEQVDVQTSNRNKPLLSAADGSWSFNGAPMNCDEISITAWDYHHVSEDFWNAQPFSPASAMYDGSAKFVLNRGVTLEGTVTDSQGSPIAGAQVGRGSERMASNVIPAQNTDSQGHFSYQFSPGQQIILTVQAKGFAPQLKQLVMGPEKQSIAFQLGKPHKIAGKVVDGSGRGVPNAQINVDTWQGQRTLQANFRTDSTGSFHWNDAPAEAVIANVYAPNVRSVDNQTLTPDQDNVIHLGKVSHIRGTVTDAETGKAIDKFKVTLGIQWQGQDSVTWQPGWDNNNWGAKPGAFDFEDSWSYPGVAVRITAQGYLPTESRVVKSDEGDATLDLKMKAGKDLIFTVLNADGKPVADATAVMATPGQQAQINNGHVMNYSSSQQATSGADGKIDFPPETGAYLIEVVADEGFAKVTPDSLSKSTDVKLEPWGQIKGTMMKGSKPAANQFVDLNNTEMEMEQYDPRKPRIYSSSSAKTDADGNFSLDRVAPGKWSVGRRVQLSSNSWSSVTLATVEVEAGKTAEVKLGGNGRPITGKVILPPDLAGRSDWNYGFSQLSTRNNISVTGPPMPLLVRMSSAETQQKWMQNWLKSDDGKKYVAAIQEQQRNMRSYPVAVESDGTFRIDDVIPGDYSLNINIMKMVTDNGMQREEQLGIGSADVTMPQIPGGRSDDPLQLDPIQITGLGKYKVGDTIADLSLVTPGGKSIKLSDFKGKYVLIDFFRGMDLLIPAFKTLSAEYGQDNRLVMMTIIPGMFPPGQTPPKLNDNPWIQAGVVTSGFGSAWQNVHSKFDIDNSSGAWLIGPDGKVVAEDLAGPAIRETVMAALGPAQVPATQPATQP